MEKVVYVLGAGFSAPLGLPLISNFRIRSQDMFQQEPEKYAHFKSVFEQIRHMSAIKNFYNADLYNIEEILSTLEMGEFLEGRSLGEEFKRYIVEVIHYYTPEMPSYPDKYPSNWYDVMFGVSKGGAAANWPAFGYFCANLLNLQFAELRVNDAIKGHVIMPKAVRVKEGSGQARYAVVTLNYDMIPETVADYIRTNFNLPDPTQHLGFSEAAEAQQEENLFGNRTFMGKLHGSVHTGQIVPPTWSKGRNPEIVPDWRLAYRLLQEATQIRIIGYSLPVADAYIKFLFKSACLDNPFLKHLDVLCLDGDGSVQARYRDFITFGAMRFAGASSSDYVFHVKNRFATLAQSFFLGTKKQHTDWLPIDVLEDVHHDFMKENA